MQKVSQRSTDEVSSSSELSIPMRCSSTHLAAMFWQMCAILSFSALLFPKRKRQYLKNDIFLCDQVSAVWFTIIKHQIGLNCGDGQAKITFPI